MDKTDFMNQFLAEKDVKEWLGSQGGNDVDRLVDKLLDTFRNEINKKNGRITRSVAPELQSSSGSNARKVTVTFNWDNEGDTFICYFICYNNSFKPDFKRIINGASRPNNKKLPLFCKCFAFSVTSYEYKNDIVACLSRALALKDGNLSTEEGIAKSLFRLYSGKKAPERPNKSDEHSTTDTKADATAALCRTLFCKNKSSKWGFWKGLSKANGTQVTDYEIATNIVNKAKMHPVFELMFNDETSIEIYEDEIITLLDASTVYASASSGKSYSSPLDGITVRSPYASFYNMLLKQQADAFLKLPSEVNQYHLTILLGEFAESALGGDHKFNPSAITKKDESYFKNDIFKEVYNDTFERRGIVEDYVFNKKLKWLFESNGKRRFSTAQHRLFFLASYDCLKYFLGQLNEEDLASLLLEKVSEPGEASSAVNHLDRKFLTFLCYSYFLFSILSAKSLPLLDKLIEYADDYSVENRSRQTAVLMLLSMLLSENYPANSAMYTKLIEHSYGRAVYDYQLLVLETIKQRSPSHIEYMKEQIKRSLMLDTRGYYSSVDPYFLLVASKIIDEADEQDEWKFLKEDEKSFFFDCVKFHGKTWPAKNIPEDSGNLQRLVNGIGRKLTECDKKLKECDAPHPAYVFGANLLFYSFSNIQRANQQARRMLFDCVDNNIIYSTLIYTDYHTRRLSSGYNQTNPSKFYMLCGPYRFVCAVNREAHAKKVNLDDKMKSIYKTWYENERKMSNGKSKRYFLLMTRLLSYTDFFDGTTIEKPSLTDWKDTKFLQYDNIPDVGEKFVDKPFKLSYSSKK